MIPLVQERKFLKKSKNSDYTKSELEIAVEKVSDKAVLLDTFADNLVEKVDNKIQQVEETVSDLTEKVDLAISEIKNIEILQGEKGEDGESPDVNQIVDTVLSKIPKAKIDEDILVAKVLKAIPKSSPSLKIIQESIDQDKLIEDIVPKLKLKIENIDGLDKSLKALDRRYVHGGGDTVAAGTGVNITTNSRGDKVINAIGGAGAVDSVNGQTGAVVLGTGDISDSLNKRYVTDADLTTISNTSNTNTGDNAVNSLYSGLGASKQDTLQSGTNIKTVNGSSLLGSGDVTITGGASIYSAEIDFGSTPVKSKRITVTDALITTLSKIMVTPNGTPATGRVGNDWEWDTILFSAVAGSGNFLLTGTASGRIKGKRNIYYTYS